MSSYKRGLRRVSSQKKGNKVTQNHVSQDTEAVIPAQIGEYLKNLNQQRADLIIRRREAEATIENCNTGIAQCDGAMAAYQETLRLFQAPPEPPTLVPQPTAAPLPTPEDANAPVRVPAGHPIELEVPLHLQE